MIFDAFYQFFIWFFIFNVYIYIIYICVCKIESVVSLWKESIQKLDFLPLTLVVGLSIKTSGNFELLGLLPLFTI